MKKKMLIISDYHIRGNMQPQINLTHEIVVGAH